MADPNSSASSPSMLDQIKALISALRNHTPSPEGTDRYPLEGQLEGYRLHVQEAKAEGTQPLTYQQWLAQQPSVSSPQE